MNPKTTEGKVAGIALRGTDKRGPLTEVDEATAVVGGGIEPERKVSRRRGVTFIAREQWEQTMAELGDDLPWHTRRANVLIEAIDLRPHIGKQIAIGEVRVELVGETEPCGLMDELRPGLRAALTPDMRAGVHGEVVRGGIFRVGDPIRLVE